MPNKCFKCGEPGHRLSNCHSKNLNLVEAEVGEAEVNDIEDEDDEESLELEVDKGELLNCIVQKKLLVSKFEKDNQHNKIFRTHGTINDKACNVIIDSGSNENIVSKAWVDLMGLSTKKHPATYRIGWIKKGTEMGVIKGCRVPFAIGKIYKSDVVFDVVDINGAIFY